MLVCCLLIPGAMIFIGTRFLKKPPARINSLYGYRTARSMRSQAAWEFAHRYCGRLWRVLGWVLLPLSVLAMLPALGREVGFIGIWSCVVVAAQVVVMLVPTLVLTESALNRQFDQTGRPKA